jgi:hypothetical protein
LNGLLLVYSANIYQINKIKNLGTGIGNLGAIGQHIICTANYQTKIEMRCADKNCA